jgi:GntR family transcriptional regulator
MAVRKPRRATTPVPSLDESGEHYLYRRIEASVRAMIAEGEMRPGMRLPSEATLAQRFGTTRVTVSKALAVLERDGLVNRAVGRGTFVAATEQLTSVIDTGRILSFEEQMGSAGLSVSYRLLGFEHVATPPFAQGRMGLPASAKIYRLDRLRLIKGRVVCLEERFIRPELAQHITVAMLARKSAMEVLGDLLGYHVPLLEVVLYPAVADRRLAQLMQIRQGSPVSVREHILRDRQKRVIECGINTFAADVRIAYTLGAATEARDEST